MEIILLVVVVVSCQVESTCFGSRSGVDNIVLIVVVVVLSEIPSCREYASNFPQRSARKTLKNLI